MLVLPSFNTDASSTSVVSVPDNPPVSGSSGGTGPAPRLGLPLVKRFTPTSNIAPAPPPYPKSDANDSPIVAASLYTPFSIASCPIPANASCIPSAVPVTNADLSKSTYPSTVSLGSPDLVILEKRIDAGLTIGRISVAPKGIPNAYAKFLSATDKSIPCSASYCRILSLASATPTAAPGEAICVAAAKLLVAPPKVNSPAFNAL